MALMAVAVLVELARLARSVIIGAVVIFLIAPLKPMVVMIQIILVLKMVILVRKIVIIATEIIALTDACRIVPIELVVLMAVAVLVALV